jgi:hypothetical protein
MTEFERQVEDAMDALCEQWREAPGTGSEAEDFPDWLVPRVAAAIEAGIAHAFHATGKHVGHPPHIGALAAALAATREVP